MGKSQPTVSSLQIGRLAEPLLSCLETLLLQSSNSTLQQSLSFDAMLSTLSLRPCSTYLPSAVVPADMALACSSSDAL